MRIPLALLIVLAAAHGQALAQKYVVEVEGVVFDRDLTPVESQRLRLELKDIPAKERQAAWEERCMAFLRENAQQLYSEKCTLVVGTSEIASQYVRTDAMKFEAHLRVMQADKDTCKLDVHIGVAYAIGQHMVAAARVTNPRTLRLNEPTFIARSSGMSRNAAGRLIAGYTQMLTMRVREATEDDLAMKTLLPNFGADLIKKRAAAPGGKLTMR
jgi:hypothetical protein